MNGLAQVPMAAARFQEFVNPHPESSGGQFGTVMLPLANGNVVITAPGDDSVAGNCGAVHLYDGKTIGSPLAPSVMVLSDGDYVVSVPNWSGDGRIRLIDDNATLHRGFYRLSHPG